MTQFGSKNVRNYVWLKMRILPIQRRRIEANLLGLEHEPLLQDEQHGVRRLSTVSVDQISTRRIGSRCETSCYSVSRPAGILRARSVRTFSRDFEWRSPLQRRLCKFDSRIFWNHSGSDLRSHAHRLVQDFLCWQLSDRYWRFTHI